MFWSGREKRKKECQILSINALFGQKMSDCGQVIEKKYEILYNIIHIEGEFSESFNKFIVQVL